MEFGIEAVTGHKLIMGARLRDDTIFDDSSNVGGDGLDDGDEDEGAGDDGSDVNTRSTVEQRTDGVFL